ncbi:helix-turn-helix domain-containing protein [Streptomyces sp. NBC_01565]|uniref:helix-turn-helix domain-containing protein n=1 Tax=Streptomyces sp. NBC_01565 TaxID=2975881 RepID=UPI00224FB97A|nr:helix-turn-helix domain-containing protein [Streptomyces sp. NBC_01565]MCX4547239.1 helix-turn-helix domain-containing protein [Streptomyces sp. NBC_01565]
MSEEFAPEDMDGAAWAEPPGEDEWDELDGPPVELRAGRRSRFKFAAAPQWVLLMTELSHPAFRLYCVLLAHVNASRDDGLVWPQQKTLAKLLGYSRRASLDPLFKALVALGLVEVDVKRYGQNKSRRRNVYTVHEEPPADWSGWASLQEFYAEEKTARKAARLAAANGSEALNSDVFAGQPGGTQNRTSGDTENRTAGGTQNRTSMNETKFSNYTKPEDDAAPAARAAGDARRAGAGSSASGRASGSAASSGAGAPNRGSRSGKAGKSAGVRMSREQAAAVAVVEAAWPEALAALLPKNRVPVVRDTILAALDGGRTPEQLAARVERRWWAHGYREALAEGGKGIGSPVGVAVGLVRPSTDCPDPMCEDGVTIDRDTACPACEERKADRKADRRQGLVPGPREAGPAPVWWDCTGEDCDATGHGPRPQDGLCGRCHDRVEAEEIERATAGLRAEMDAQYAAQAERVKVAARWDAMLDAAYAEHAERAAAKDAARQARRAAEAEETRLLREQLAAEHPELAAFAQQTEPQAAATTF